MPSQPMGGNLLEMIQSLQDKHREINRACDDMQQQRQDVQQESASMSLEEQHLQEQIRQGAATALQKISAGQCEQGVAKRAKQAWDGEGEKLSSLAAKISSCSNLVMQHQVLACMYFRAEPMHLIRACMQSQLAAASFSAEKNFRSGWTSASIQMQTTHGKVPGTNSALFSLKSGLQSLEAGWQSRTYLLNLLCGKLGQKNAALDSAKAEGGRRLKAVAAASAGTVHTTYIDAKRLHRL